MASYDYNGKSYFYALGRWVDEVSRPVKPEISEALDGLYSKDEIKAREAESKKNRKAVPKKRIVSQETYYKSNKSKHFSVNNSCSVKTRHKKASQQYYAQRVDLTSDQKRALALLESGNNVFLTGEAGTGKSFVLNEFLYRNRRKNILVCAPTGIAAINVGGSTLHRVFNAPIGVARPGDYNSKPDESVVKADIVVIDEISMCRFDLFEYVIRTIKNAEVIRQNDENVDAINNGRMPEIIKPKQIIVVGDFYQLAPVISTKDKEVLFTYWDRETVGDGFAFISPLWKDLDFKIIIVKEIVRQAGETDYVENLNKIRIGDYSGIEWFNNNITRQPIPNGIYLCGTNQKADEINLRESNALPGKIVKYSAQVKGTVGPGDKMTMDELSLKIGMQVMTLINDTSEGFQNGSIGKVAALESDHVDVRLNNGRLVTVTMHDWEILGYEVQEDKLEKVVLGNFKQLPLKIAYAITIHKSQGQTYSSVNISPDCFAAGQLYVALSRAKTAGGMSLEHMITRSSLRTSMAVRRFYEDLIESEDTFEIEQLSLFDHAETTDDVDILSEDSYELPFDDNDDLDDLYKSDESEVPERKSSIYNKVMSMDDEMADSCTMYRSIKDHPSAYASWTEEEDEKLIQEIKQGLKTKQIAEIHQRTNGAIRSRIKKLNDVIGDETTTNNENTVDISEAINEELFLKLKELRKEISNYESIPAFCVFPDVSLIEMSIFCPRTKQEMLNITGVGEAKYDKYGERFLSFIADNVNNNGIEEKSSALNNIKETRSIVLKHSKTEFEISEEYAKGFVFNNSMSVKEVKTQLNSLNDLSKTKKITSKQILEYLNELGYVSEKFVDGVWINVISDEGLKNGVHYVRHENKLGIEYVSIGFSRHIQEMIVKHFIR